MKAEDNHIMNILYSPIMYIHSDLLSELPSSMGILNDVILNHWIINKYHLEHLPDTWQPDDVVSKLIFTHWEMIPKITEFIGGYLLRERLLIEKTSLISDSKLLAFISLPLRHTVVVGQQNNNINHSAWGTAFIIKMTRNLPTALQQRLRLCFSPNIRLPNIYMTKTPDHINLLRMAINYAHDF